MCKDTEVSTSSSCANCGIAEIDDIKLKECDDCDLVRYCSDACLTDHKSKHKEACMKRAAEIRDELLFKQPESMYLGDCPICCLPLPIDQWKSTVMDCCSKVICNGCSFANDLRIRGGNLQHNCAFCREPTPNNIEEGKKLRMKRIKVNDPFSMRREGLEQYKQGDYRKAFEYFMKAAELGDVDAQFKLSGLYLCGEGVEKDEVKGMYHLEEAAIGGHPRARHAAGLREWGNNGNAERAVKHWVIAAGQGDDDSIKTLMKKFRNGVVSKECLAAALRAHQAAVDATKSPQREAVERFKQK